MRKSIIVLLFLTIAIMVFPIAVYAGNLGDAIKFNFVPAVTTLVSLIASGGLIAKIRTISKIRVAAVDVGHALAMIRLKVTDPETIKDFDNALESVADVLDELGVKTFAEKLRKVY